MAGNKDEGFDVSAAVTRSLLGWGIVAGIFYLLVSILQGLRRDGFSFADHQLSLLMLGDFGWIQATNLIVTGLMVSAAAIGFMRATRPDRRAHRVGSLLAITSVGFIGSGVFPPDPVDGFPDPGSSAEATASGVVHLAFGGIAFLALSAAAFIAARWLRDQAEQGRARWSAISGGVIVVGFVGGAVLATTVAGVAFLWVAVLTGWVWLAATCLHVYRLVPHPDLGTHGSSVEVT